MIETLMTNIVKEKIPASASFFRRPIDAFQSRFVDMRMTSALSDIRILQQVHRRAHTDSGHPL